LLDSQQFADSRAGKVTVYFHLNADGTVTELNIIANSVGSLLGYVCQEAVEQAAPFGKWPSDMRQLIGANYREITFTFYYY
jgi:TonB family protein